MKTTRTFLSSPVARLISFRTLRESAAERLMNTMNWAQPRRALPTSSGHSLPGSTPSSYQIRYRLPVSFLITEKTSRMFLWE